MATSEELNRVQRHLRSWSVIGCSYEDAVADIDAGVYDWLLGPRPKPPVSWWRKLWSRLL